MTADDGRPRLGSRKHTGGPGDPVVFAADEQAVVSVDLMRWTLLAEQVLVAEGVRGHVELNVLYVERDEIAELNAQFMDAEGPTDVLSFPIDADEIMSNGPDPTHAGPDRAPVDEDDLPLLLGDVVICPQVAQQQFADHAGTLDDELALLLVHGILHLLGFDHHDPEAKAAMWARERSLLEAHHWNGPAPSGFNQDQPDYPET
jgi:probable rRNA maturation factor